MYSDMNSDALPPEDYSIRKSAYQGILTAPRGLSQFSTSFIGSWYQGIHHLLLVALPNIGIYYTNLIVCNYYYAVVKVQCEAFASFQGSFKTLKTE